MRSEARLDMRDRDTGGEAGQRAAKRAGRVALNDEQVGTVREQRSKGIADAAHMRMRIALARTAELNQSKLPSPKSAAVRPLC